MTRALRTTRLYLSNWSYSLLTPALILLIMVAISVVIALIVGIRVGLPLPMEGQEGMSFNQGALWCIPGFLVSVGAITVNRLFATALAFGSTRRDFWLGSSLGFVITSLATGVGAVILLLLEKVTGHWFIGARAMDVLYLGNGDVLQTFVTITVLALLSLFVGAGFGTIYRCYGPVATAATGIGLGVVLAATIAVFVWKWEAIAPLITDLGLWFFVLMAVALALVAGVTSFVANRRATF